MADSVDKGAHATATQQQQRQTKIPSIWRFDAQLMLPLYLYISAQNREREREGGREGGREGNKGERDRGGKEQEVARNEEKE